MGLMLTLDLLTLEAPGTDKIKSTDLTTPIFDSNISSDDSGKFDDHVKPTTSLRKSDVNKKNECVDLEEPSAAIHHARSFGNKAPVDLKEQSKRSSSRIGS